MLDIKGIQMKTIAGFSLILLGIGVVIFGPKEIRKNKNWLTKSLFPENKISVVLQSFVFGGVLVWIGVYLLN